MRDTRQRVRSSAALALAQIGAPEITDCLADYLVTDEDFSGIDELRRIGKPMLGALSAKLDDPNANHRRIAVKFLGKIGNSHSVTGLVNALSDSNAQVRAQAAIALGEIGDRSVTDHLASALLYPEAE